uniref:Serine/threonine protein kinase n=1 Tax=Solibacter usitatus (strain Ellin6076) TaxID=234267 RepID=Q01PE0_SOLUE
MTPPATIAHYRIISKIGQGGMGTVYRAMDTKLGREVAIKILPDQFAADSSRMARFSREAKVLAALNHPNIAAIYGVEECALVMELVAGKPLAGPLPVDTALDYARQIADALDYAHDKGIVHRDLKPANIMVTPEGVVKVLDFGLAKATAEDVRTASESFPTVTLDETEPGVVMGTARYMAPEQARGKPVDKRADIWAFGVVLYEILTGKHLFQGDTASDTIVAVLTLEPNWDAVPPRVQGLLRRCLERDPRKRLRDIGDVGLLLEEGPPTIPVSRRRLGRAVVGTLALVSMALAGMLWRANRGEPRPMIRFDADLGLDAVDMAPSGSEIVISPDGSLFAYTVRTQGGPNAIATRSLDQAEAAVLRGTEGGNRPFFSPDGQWLGFFIAGQMKKISIHGGPVAMLCDAPGSRGASWGPDGYIVANLTLGGGLFRVPDGGGSPQALTDPAATSEATHRWPQVLPGGRAVLFTGHATTANYDEANIEVLSLETGKLKVVHRGGYHGRYVPTGHLLYVNQSTLYAVPFNLNRLEEQGAPVPMVGDIAGNRNNGAGQFDSRNGMLVYYSNRYAPKSWPVVWIDREGRQQVIPLDPGRYSQPRISPDGTRLAMTVGREGGSDIGIYDFQRQTMTRLTFAQNNSHPVWAPDGKHLVFLTETSRLLAIRWMRADGAGETRTLFEDKNELIPWSFSPDGQLAFTWLAKDASYHLWTLPLDLRDLDNPKTGPPAAVVHTRFTVSHPAFSPDGRWIAYRSGEKPEGIYVRRFPPGAEDDTSKWQVSVGGAVPGWSRTGKQLFYEKDGRFMVVNYDAGPDSFSVDKEREWSNEPLPMMMRLGGDAWPSDVAPDGKRFLVFPMPEKDREAARSVHAFVLLNFFDELRRRVPVH